MQLTPATQKWVQETLIQTAASGDEGKDNIEAGATYLGFLLDKFGSEPDALAAYLQGPGSVQNAGASDSTKARVKEVLDLTARLRAAPGASPAVVAPAASATTAAAASTTTSDASTTDATLQAQLDAFVAQQPKDMKIAVVAYNLTTQEDVWVNGDDVFPAASLLKLGIMTAVFEDASAGKLKLTDSVQNDLSQMLTVSDNDAANRLMDQIGIDRVNKVLSIYGLTDTKLSNHFSASSNSGEPVENETTASDMEFLVELMATDQLVDKPSSAQMRELLGQTEDDSKLLRPIPSNVNVDHKSGWYPGVAHDVGVVYAPRSTYAIAVLTSGAESDDAGDLLIGTSPASSTEPGEPERGGAPRADGLTRTCSRVGDTFSGRCYLARQAVPARGAPSEGDHGFLERFFHLHANGTNVPTEIRQASPRSWSWPTSSS